MKNNRVYFNSKQAAEQFFFSEREGRLDILCTGPFYDSLAERWFVVVQTWALD